MMREGFLILRRIIESDRRGALLVETAMTIPVLITMVLGGIEVTRFVLLRQSLDRAATTVGDLVSQAPKLTEDDIPF